MSRVVWGATGSRYFETGVDRGVLFAPISSEGVPWNGLTAVSEAPSGGDPQPYYIDGVKYLQVPASEEFNATVEAFSSPREFGMCDGTANIYGGLFITQQPRQQFGLTYRSLIGNDVDAESHGYKIHLVYNAIAKPTARSNTSLSDNVDPLALSWAITTVPPLLSGFKPSAHLIIDSTLTQNTLLAAVEDLLYGSDGLDSHLPNQQDLITMFSTWRLRGIVPNPDTGLTVLTHGGQDLIEDTSTAGVLTAQETTRLVESEVPGIYTLEE